MQFLERIGGMHTLLLHDGWHVVPFGSPASALAHKTKSRGHAVREKHSLLGGGSAGAAKTTASAGTGVIKIFPDEKKVIEALEITLPEFLRRNAGTLVHVELQGLILTNWTEVIRLLKRCTNLQRLYLKACNLGDRLFADLSLVLKSLHCLNHLQLAGLGLTAHSASLITSLIKIQSEKRNSIHWQAGLRRETTAPPSISILVPDNLSSQGLMSLDVSENKLGDKGVSLLADCLSRDAWIKAVDFSGNSFGEEGLKSIVACLEENKSILWMQISGPREANVNLHSDSPIKRVSSVPRVGNLGPGGSGAGYRRSTISESSMKLLQTFDPHFSKRAKRLLLLFHQQQLDTTKFLTGRNPLSPAAAAAAAAEASRDGLDAMILSPTGSGIVRRTRLPALAPLAPDASGIFDRFFKAHGLQPKLHSGAFDHEERPATATAAPVRSPTKPKRAKAGVELLSPTIRGLAERKQAEKEREASPKRPRSAASARGASSSAAHPPRTGPTPTALNFLFPALALICPPDRLFQPDITLRGKPPRTDNSWPTGYKPADTDAAPHKNRPLSASGLLSPAFSKHPSSAAPPAHDSPDKPDGNGGAGGAHSPLDFRPYLRETCVASTADYIKAEKEAYKRVLLRKREEAEMQARRERGEAVLRVATGVEPQYQTDEGTELQPLSPVGSRSQQRLQQVPDELSAAPGSSASVSSSNQGLILQSLVDENVRLSREMDRLEARQQQQQQSSRLLPTPNVAELPPVGDRLDVHAMTTLLVAASAAAESDTQDPELLAYLEAQFAKLHAYVDLLEQAVPDQIERAQAQKQVETDAAAVASEGDALQIQEDRDASYPSEMSRAHASVERVDQSPSPSPTAAAASSSSVSSHDPHPSDPAVAPAADPSLHVSSSSALSAMPVQVEDEVPEDSSSIQEELQQSVAGRISEMYELDAGQ